MRLHVTWGSTKCWRVGDFWSTLWDFAACSTGIRCNAAGPVKMVCLDRENTEISWGWWCDIWLVVWNMNFIFPYINDNANWLIFSEGSTTNQLYFINFIQVQFQWLRCSFKSEPVLLVTPSCRVARSQVANWGVDPNLRCEDPAVPHQELGYPQPPASRQRPIHGPFERINSCLSDHCPSSHHEMWISIADESNINH